MSKNTKITLGIITFLPILFYIYYFIGFFNMMSSISEIEASGNPDEFMSEFMGLFASMGLASLMTLGLMIYYIVHVTQQKMYDSNERLMWILILVFTSSIGAIIYWCVKIWPEAKPEPVSEEILDEELV